MLHQLKARYCLPTLIKDKPDVIVIHVGTNSLFNDQYCEIANQIFNLVKICRDHGVNETFVSGVTLRKNHMMKVRQVNNLIDMKKLIYDFKFINNDNIFEKDIGKDNIHLNYTGIVQIANNIIRSINTLHTA